LKISSAIGGRCPDGSWAPMTGTPNNQTTHVAAIALRIAIEANFIAVSC